MNILWNETEAAKCSSDPLALRVYSSRLLGQEKKLVLHGGGNTSVKIETKNIFGESENLLHVKGSGWDLATIDKPGFPGLRLETLWKLAELDELSDSEMMRIQKSAMVDPSGPAPSVEAILHGLIPFKYVDHTHADAVVTVSNTPSGRERIAEIYGDRMLIVPYVMPGFILAKTVYQMTRGMDWDCIEGMILLNHGIFTFDNDARKSYEKMIKHVTTAENYIKKKTNLATVSEKEGELDLLKFAQIRRKISEIRGQSQIAIINSEPESIQFSEMSNVESIATRGPLTPDHVIRTKRIPAILKGIPEENIDQFVDEYHRYFKRNAKEVHHCLDPAPRWAIWPGSGILSFGSNRKEGGIVENIVKQTICAIQVAEKIEQWKALSEEEIFEVEYWELEQAKLRKNKTPLELQGKIALVTGAASGIGRACVEELLVQGACVAALDIQPDIVSQFQNSAVLGMQCDVTDPGSVKQSVDLTIREFGGLDLVFSNAGTFPKSQSIHQLDGETWRKSLDVNLTSHQLIMKYSIPYLEVGLDPAIIIIASKNVLAPGKGAASYSVAKAGLTQLARIAALELAEKGIRVNTIHPNAVFDTSIWTTEVLEERAKRSGMTVEEYKSSNLLKVEITSQDVARLACEISGPTFEKITGAQIPIDGGNERVI